MPLNGRNFSQLSLLLPGVMTTAPDTFTEPKNFGQGRPYVNGQREQENNFMLDGMDMNEAIDNLLPYQPSPDALAEVRVDTNNYSAEYGNVAGALVNSTIKSGTNDFHGNGFEYWRDSSLAANSWDNNRAGATKADLRSTSSAPPSAGRSCGTRCSSSATTRASCEIVQANRLSRSRRLRGGRATSRASSVPIIDPQTGQQFPGNQIPQERFSPVARAILANDQLYPLPTRPGDSNNLVDRLGRQAAGASGRRQGRRQPLDADRLFGRFSYQHYTSEPERARAREPVDRYERLALPRPRVQLEPHHVRASSVNELLFGYTKVKFQTQNTDWAGIGDANATVGIPGGQAIAGPERLQHHGRRRVRQTPASQEFNDIKSYQFSDKYTMFKGRHQLKFGGRWLYQRQGFSYSGTRASSVTSTTAAPSPASASPTSCSTTCRLKGKGGAVSPFTHLQNRVSVYGQDDFRIRNDLTLNLGLSWEYTSPLVEKDDRQSNIDLHTGQLLLAGQRGNSRALYDAYYGGFEPRLGFAWSPSDKWVVRGGFGIVQYMEGTGKNLRLPANPPFNFEGQRSFDKTTGPGSAATGFDDVTPSTTGGPGTLYRIFAPDVRPQLTKQWNVFVERKLTDALSGQVGYVGSRSSHMVVPFDFNQPEPGSGPGQHVAAARRTASLVPAEPRPRHADERHELDRRRQVRRAAGEPPAAPRRGPRVPRVVHVRQGAQRQHRLLRRRLGSDGGPGLLLHGQQRSSARLRPVALRRAAHVQRRRELRAAVRQGQEVRHCLDRQTWRSAGGT